MQLSIRVHRTGSGLGGAAKQFAFATANAMNRTLEEAQAEQRRGQRQRFTVRTPFLDRLVKIGREDRARRDRLVARIRIEGPEGSEGRASILTKHEEGGLQRRPGGGYSIDPRYRVQGMFYLPTPVLRWNASTVIPRAMYPTSLRLAARRDIDGSTMAAKVHKTATGKLQMKGKQRTFVLFGANGGAPIGIFQRGDGSKGRTHTEDFHMVWRFRRSITLKKRLQFLPTVRRTVETRYTVNLRGMLTHALRTAR